jgi:hypothetical protein
MRTRSELAATAAIELVSSMLWVRKDRRLERTLCLWTRPDIGSKPRAHVPGVPHRSYRRCRGQHKEESSGLARSWIARTWRQSVDRISCMRSPKEKERDLGFAKRHATVLLKRNCAAGTCRRQGLEKFHSPIGAGQKHNNDVGTEGLVQPRATMVKYTNGQCRSDANRHSVRSATLPCFSPSFQVPRHRQLPKSSISMMLRLPVWTILRPAPEPAVTVVCSPIHRGHAGRVSKQTPSEKDSRGTD